MSFFRRIPLIYVSSVSTFLRFCYFHDLYKGWTVVDFTPELKSPALEIPKIMSD